MNDWAKDEVIKQISKKPFGTAIAEKLVNKIKEKKAMCYVHRDYCGIGFFYEYNVFYFSPVWEGYMHSVENAVVSFTNEKEVINFISRQSDYSFSGADDKSVFYETDKFKLNNQRITRQMVVDFLNDT